MKDVSMILMVVLVLAVVGTSSATTVTLTSDADSYVAGPHSGFCWNNYGTLDHMDLVTVPASNVGTKAYVRFVLPADFGSAISVSLKVVVSAKGTGDMWSQVYGLNDGASGQGWGETTINWNNAPANNTTLLNGFTSDATLVGANYLKTTDLGVTKTVTDGDMLTFINTDTDKMVTFMMDALGTKSYSLASKENVTYAAPQLVLIYTPVPEPATLAILGFGSLLCIRRR